MTLTLTMMSSVAEKVDDREHVIVPGMWAFEANPQ